MMDHRPVAFAEARDAGARPRDRAADLVAEDARPGQQALHDLLDVRPADAAGLDAHEHLAGGRLGDGNVLHAQEPLAPVDGGTHEQAAILANPPGGASMYLSRGRFAICADPGRGRRH